MHKTNAGVTLLMMFFLFLSPQLSGQNTEMLLGNLKKNDFLVAPYDEWFKENFNAYQVDVNALQDIDLQKDDLSVLVFLGSWCGDTRRELPRFLKIMEFLEFPENKISLIGLDRTKKAPVYTENIWNIEFVPTFIFLKKGAEIGRIIEQPTLSLEQDLKQILGMKYIKKKENKLLSSWEKADSPPIFGHCDQYSNPVERLNCSDAQLHLYFKNNLIHVYGNETLSGSAMVRFIVDLDGDVKNVKITRTESSFAEVEARRLMNGMNGAGIGWKPAKKDGKAVAVWHECLIRFDHQ